MRSVWVMVGVGGKWTWSEPTTGGRADGNGKGVVAGEVLRIGRGGECIPSRDGCW